MRRLRAPNPQVFEGTKDKEMLLLLLDIVQRVELVRLALSSTLFADGVANDADRHHKAEAPDEQPPEPHCLAPRRRLPRCPLLVGR